MDKVRAFVAIELEEPVIEALETFQRRLKRVIDLPVRWANPRGVHLTLKFLGDVEVGRIDAVRAAVKRAAASDRPFAVALGSFGVFPSLRRPRVLWVALEGELELLGSLQARVEEELAGLGFSTEDRPFQPHLTLGRVRQDRGLQGAIDASVAGAAPSATQRVTGLSLMRSELKPSGAVYTRLAELRLGAGAA